MGTKTSMVVIPGGAGLAALTQGIGSGRTISAGLISAITFQVDFDRLGGFNVIRAIH